MERVLEGAVEHGAALTRDRLQAVLPPGDTLMDSENARARGFRLEGYGVFFDVIVPPFETETTLTWSLRTLDQNDSRSRQRAQSAADPHQVAGRCGSGAGAQARGAAGKPCDAGRPAPVRAIPGARNAIGSAASTGADPPPDPADPILTDPNEAYRSEVVAALKDAMLDHSSSLGIGENDWLTIAAKGNDDRPRLAPADSDARTRIIRLRGADLLAYLARQIPKEEALKRIEVKFY